MAISVHVLIDPAKRRREGGQPLPARPVLLLAATKLPAIGSRAIHIVHFWRAHEQHRRLELLQLLHRPFPAFLGVAIGAHKTVELLRHICEILALMCAPRHLRSGPLEISPRRWLLRDA